MNEQRGAFSYGPGESREVAPLVDPNVRAYYQKLERQAKELSEQLEFDRTAVAASMTAANKAIDGRHWLTEGRGPYEWNDDRWHSEFYAAAVEIKAALEPLTKIAANWTSCPVKADEVAAARIDWKQRAEAAEQRVAELAGKLAEAQKDTARLDGIQAELAKFSMELRIGRAPVGNISIGVLIRPGASRLTPIRAAIDAAMSQEEKSNSGERRES